MSNEKVKREDNAKQEHYPTNHRIRPKGMPLSRAAVIGREIAEKDPDFHILLQVMKDFAKVKEYSK